MIYYTRECVSCSLPCIYEACPNYRVANYKCDFCEEEDVKLYKYNGWEICEDCLLKNHEVVEGSDDW